MGIFWPIIAGFVPTSFLNAHGPTTTFGINFSVLLRDAYLYSKILVSIWRVTIILIHENRPCYTTYSISFEKLFQQLFGRIIIFFQIQCPSIRSIWSIKVTDKVTPGNNKVNDHPGKEMLNISEKLKPRVMFTNINVHTRMVF